MSLDTFFTSSHPRCSIKKDVLKNFAKLTGKRLCQSLFFNKVAVLRPATGTGVFLWILRNFQEQVFYRAPPGDCFWFLTHSWVITTISKETQYAVSVLQHACFPWKIPAFFLWHEAQIFSCLNLPQECF